MKASKVIACLVLPFTLAACGESALEKAAKPPVIEEMVKSSLAVCETGPKNPSNEDYAARLRAIMMETNTADLKTIGDNKITVCLDQRLSGQVNGMWDMRIDGIFYNTSGQKVISIWDNGKNPDEKRGFLEMSSSSYGNNMLARIADGIRSGDVSGNDKVLLAGRYSCGKACTTTRWKTRQDFDQGSIRKNPELLSPPSVHKQKPSA